MMFATAVFSIVPVGDAVAVVVVVAAVTPADPVLEFATPLEFVAVALPAVPALVVEAVLAVPALAVPALTAPALVDEALLAVVVAPAPPALVVAVVVAVEFVGSACPPLATAGSVDPSLAFAGSVRETTSVIS